MTKPNNELGKMLRQARVRAALSLDDVSQRSGLSKSFLHFVEVRGAKMSQAAAGKLASVLGLDGDELAARFWLQRVPKDLWPAMQSILAAEPAESLSA